MDSTAKQQTAKLLQRLKDEGVTIMISSHEAHTVEHIADHHIHIEHGNALIRPPNSNNVTMINTAKKTSSYE
jgi:tungstate transport system ATP-binding protein